MPYPSSQASVIRRGRAGPSKALFHPGTANSLKIRYLAGKRLDVKRVVLHHPGKTGTWVFGLVLKDPVSGNPVFVARIVEKLP